MAKVAIIHQHYDKSGIINVYGADSEAEADQIVTNLRHMGLDGNFLQFDLLDISFYGRGWPDSQGDS
jgi:hypothetical protein